jgi:hypothetical protein
MTDAAEDLTVGTALLNKSKLGRRRSISLTT